MLLLVKGKKQKKGPQPFRPGRIAGRFRGLHFSHWSRENEATL